MSGAAVEWQTWQPTSVMGPRRSPMVVTSLSAMPITWPVTHNLGHVQTSERHALGRARAGQPATVVEVGGLQLKLHEDPLPTEGMLAMPDEPGPVQTGSKYTTQGRNE